MLPRFLLPEHIARADGVGPAIDMVSSRGKLIVLTLGITRILEHQTLDITIWGSPDAKNWGSKPLLSFPQKFYCGMYSVLLDLAAHPEARHLRVQWKMTRWKKLDTTPLFAFYVNAEESGARLRYAVA